MSDTGRDDNAPAENLGYYGVPVIHRPHWRWEIVGYFFLGGISGSAAALAALGQLTGGRAGRQLSTRAMLVSFATLLPCPVLLILDLGRPRRFLNMLRVLRPTSPMSVGSWGLAAFGGFATAAVTLQLANARFARGDPQFSARLVRAERAVVPCAGALGLFVAGYTGTLLAATAVPLWSRRPALLGPLFLSSAAASGTAAVAAVVALTPGDEPELEESLRRLELVTSLAEGAALAAWLYALGPTAKPLLTGRLGTMVRHVVAGAGVALPLAIGALGSTLPRPARRGATLLASALTLAGGLALRYTVVAGGRASADDPRATFELTG